MGIELSLAAQDDLPAIRDLVRRSGLSPRGLEQSRWVFKATQAGRLIGAGAIDILGPYALCRSLAVEPGQRRGGVGGMLVRRWVDTCQVGRLDAYLVTRRWHAPYFARFGFRVVPKSSTPPEVRRHWQLASFLYAVPFRPFLCVMERKLAS